MRFLRLKIRGILICDIFYHILLFGAMASSNLWYNSGMVQEEKGRFFEVTFLIVVLLVAAMVGCIIFSVQGFIARDTSKELPRVEIVLADGVTLEDINNSEKKINFEGNELILVKDSTEMLFDGVGVRGRGNVSWASEKKPYRIKFANKVDFLGMGRHKKWAFLAYDLDDSLLRGDLGFYLAKMIDEDYPLWGEFVDFYMGGYELGLYYVTPTVSIDKKIVDLRDEGGILMEADGAWYGDEYYVRTKLNNYLVGKDAVVEENLVVSLERFKSAFELFEDAVMKGDYDSVKKVVDVESLANYFLFSEFTQNYDAYYTSFYLYKDGFDDAIHFGPAWDFDGIAGNKRWREGRYEETLLPETVFTDWWSEEKSCLIDDEASAMAYANAGLRQMMCRLVLMPEFRNVVQNNYREKLFGKKEEVINYIEMKADYIREAANRNNEIWDHGSFEEELEYLIWWVGERFDYFDKKSVVVPFELKEI